MEGRRDRARYAGSFFYCMKWCRVPPVPICSNVLFAREPLTRLFLDESRKASATGHRLCLCLLVSSGHLPSQTRPDLIRGRRCY
jgi:hypothetical protein